MFCEWRHNSRSSPARRSRAEHRETDCNAVSNCNTTRSVAPDQPDSARPCIEAARAFQPTVTKRTHSTLTMAKDDGMCDQTILYERPSDLTPNALAIQADSRASGDRMLDQKTTAAKARSHRELCQFYCAISKQKRVGKRVAPVPTKRYGHRQTHRGVVQ